MKIRRWSATVSGAPPRRHHEPGYLEVRRVPTVETQGPGLGVAPLVRSFPGRGPGSENRAHPPSHPDGCLRSRLGDAPGAATMTASAAPAGAASAQPQIPQFAAAQSAATWVAGQQAAERQHRRLSLDHGERHPGPGRRPRRHGGGPGRIELRGGQCQFLHHRRQCRRSGPAGQPDLRRARLGVDPTNFGGTNLVTPAAGDRADLGPDAGPFGTETQLGDFEYVGTYDQGLVLAALKAVGGHGQCGGDRWLTAQQCPSGGWAFPNQAVGVCAGGPSEAFRVPTIRRLRSPSRVSLRRAR